MDKVKKKKVVANYKFPSKTVELFTHGKALRCCTLYITNSKKLRRRCHVDMTAKGRDVFSE
jgi:hypothetical protein